MQEQRQESRPAVPPLVSVAGITLAALAVVGVLGILAARSTPTVSAPPPGRDPAPGGPGAGTSATADLPAGTGSGPRIVYAAGSGRVWVVDRDDAVGRTHVADPADRPTVRPGTYQVHQKRRLVIDPDTGQRHRFVVRFAAGAPPGRERSLGFCSVPVGRDGQPLGGQTGTPGGETGRGGPATCVQQRVADAEAVWRASTLRTRVAVVP